VVERELGRGGMATVYLARDLQQDRVVALKVLRPELSGLVGAERFAREIAIAARLNHPHILPIYDSGSLELGDGAAVRFYTMPFVAGKSLRDRLAEAPQLPIEEAVRIARQAAEALEHAHHEGVVHRDIKPENILLAGDNALVADFGIARATDAAGERLTQTGLALGTPAYMSPEQATGTTRLDGRADIYALGCVLYEMLAGEPPFTGPTAQAILARHAMDRVPSLRTLRPEVSAGLSRVVRRALAKVPADRYPTARAFADQLAAPETERTEDVVPGVTRRLFVGPRALVLAGLLALAAAAGVWAVMSRTRPAPPTPLDPTVVAVAPFRVSSRNPALAYLREGIVDLLTTQLGGTMAVKPVDSRTVLDAWRRARGSPRSEADGPAIARMVGAGQLVEGELVTSGASATLSARLSQVADGKEMARITIDGATDSLTPLIARLGRQLLSRAAGEPEERLPALAAASPSALRAYLDGWALLRRQMSDEARRQFHQALALDSTFAPAALGAARARFEGEWHLTDPEFQMAWRLRDRLTPRDQAYLEAIVGPRYPAESFPREQMAAAERLTRVSPGNADGWNLYAVSLCEGWAATAEFAARCPDAYRRAFALDSTSPFILNNVAHRAVLIGDTALARRVLRRLLLSDSVSPGVTMLKWQVATRLGDTAAARRGALSDSMMSVRADWNVGGPLYGMMGYFASEGLGWSDVELALERSRAIAPTESQRDELENVAWRLAVIRGRADSLPLPPASHGHLWNYDRVVDALFAGADPAGAALAAAALEHDLGAPGHDGCCVDQFALAEFALERGRFSTVRRVLADFERLSASSSSPAGESDPAPWRLMVSAQLAARERSPEAGERLGRLDSALAYPSFEWKFIWLYGNLISARLHQERGEYGSALAAIRRRFDIFWPPVVAYHREEGRIAAQAGDTAGAIRAYERYLRIRADAEPRLQPQVQQVRAELAALTRSR
jgi:serine/threonine-protein kinase